LSPMELSIGEAFIIKHPFNGEFYVWSFPL